MAKEARETRERAPDATPPRGKPYPRPVAGVPEPRAAAAAVPTRVVLALREVSVGGGAARIVAILSGAAGPSRGGPEAAPSR